MQGIRNDDLSLSPDIIILYFSVIPVILEVFKGRGTWNKMILFFHLILFIGSINEYRSTMFPWGAESSYRLHPCPDRSHPQVEKQTKKERPSHCRLPECECSSRSDAAPCGRTSTTCGLTGWYTCTLYLPPRPAPAPPLYQHAASGT